MGMKEFCVQNVYVSDEEYLLLLKGKGQEAKVLPMVIGAYEANCVLMALEKVPSERPYVFDLFYDVIEKTNTTLENLCIYDLRDGIFYSKLTICYSGHDAVSREIRPSDGIVLALRHHVPIYVNDTVIEKMLKDGNIQEAIMDITESELKEQDTDYLEELKNMDGGLAKVFHNETMDKDLNELNRELDFAVKEERYEEAARIRDRIIRLKQGGD